VNADKLSIHLVMQNRPTSSIAHSKDVPGYQILNPGKLKTR
jgi:hypothetical protein